MNENNDSIHDYKKEWLSLTNPPSYTTNPELYSSSLANYSKNRYDNIHALEVTRVHLKNEEYINANYVNITPEKKVIVAQGPLQNTIDDFWNMIWENKSPVILMLTKLIENKNLKCDLYWPTLPGTFIITKSSIKITCTKTDLMGHFCVTKFYISNGTEGHYLTHYNYQNWPDFNLPDPLSITENLKQMKPIVESNSAPIVVHCSAGVGRSGVWCALMRSILTGESVPESVNNIRLCRYGMVQTLNQYKFIYKLLESI